MLQSTEVFREKPARVASPTVQVRSPEPTAASLAAAPCIVSRKLSAFFGDVAGNFGRFVDQGASHAQLAAIHGDNRRSRILRDDIAGIDPAEGPRGRRDGQPGGRGLEPARVIIQADYAKDIADVACTLGIKFENEPPAWLTLNFSAFLDEYERTLRWTTIGKALAALTPFAEKTAAGKAGFDTGKAYKFKPSTPSLPDPLGEFHSFLG